MIEPRPLSSPALVTFGQLADDYCRLIETSDSLDATGLICQAHLLIPRLYVAAIALPSTDILYDGSEDSPEDDDLPVPEFTKDPDRREQAEWSALYERLRATLGKWCDYREIFDPYEPPAEKEVQGSLADDLADIYFDLRTGLRKWNRGDGAGALWEWRVGLENHWGEHATGALRAMHTLASNYDMGWPKPEPGAA